MIAPRVVSLVPSATETLRAWGIDPVAVTRFCPAGGAPTVGGTKDPHVVDIVGLRPDLVVLCKEENRREDADALAAAGLEVFVFEIDRVADVEPSLRALADALVLDPSVPLVASATPVSPPGVTRRAWVPIWRRPWMTLGASTYGGDVLRTLGIEHVFDDSSERYPLTTLDEARSREPTVVIAPSEPYPFAERHRAELETVAPVTFVDGEDLFWWGWRTPAALARLAQALA